MYYINIDCLLPPQEIQISIDDCHKSDCQQLGDPIGNHSLLNVNGPLQLGGTRNSLEKIGRFLAWEYMPSPYGFVGCIRNLTYNGYTYDLGNPSESKNAYPDCNYGVAKAVSFGINSKFLVAILVCIAILLSKCTEFIFVMYFFQNSKDAVYFMYSAYLIFYSYVLHINLMMKQLSTTVLSQN